MFFFFSFHFKFLYRTRSYTRRDNGDCPPTLKIFGYDLSPPPPKNVINVDHCSRAEICKIEKLACTFSEKCC